MPYKPVIRNYVTHHIKTESGATSIRNLTASGNFLNSFNGSSVPTWKRLIASRKDASSAASGTLYVNHQRVPGIVRHEGTGPKRGREIWLRGFGVFPHPGVFKNPSSGLKESVENEALSKLLKQAQDRQRGFQGATFLGELKDVVRMLRHPFTGVNGLLTDWLYKVPRNWRRNLRAVSDSWLEVQYGLRPLLSDINSALNAINSLARNFETSRVVILSSAQEEVEFRPSSYYLHSSTYKASFVAVEYAKYSVAYHGAVWLLPTDYQWWGADPLRDWLPTAWELLPWSFLIDYFTNIGEIVNRSSFRSSDMVFLCRSERTDHREELSRVKYSPINSSWKLVTHVPERQVLIKRDWTRTPISDVPIPSFTFRAPGLGNLKWLNISALLAGRLRLRN